MLKNALFAFIGAIDENEVRHFFLLINEEIHLMYF
jgi:hypothetical protein